MASKRKRTSGSISSENQHGTGNEPINSVPSKGRPKAIASRSMVADRAIGGDPRATPNPEAESSGTSSNTGRQATAKRMRRDPDVCTSQTSLWQRSRAEDPSTKHNVPPDQARTLGTHFHLSSSSSSEHSLLSSMAFQQLAAATAGGYAIPLVKRHASVPDHSSGSSTLALPSYRDISDPFYQPHESNDHPPQSHPLRTISYAFPDTSWAQQSALRPSHGATFFDLPLPWAFTYQRPWRGLPSSSSSRHPGVPPKQKALAQTARMTSAQNRQLPLGSSGATEAMLGLTMSTMLPRPTQVYIDEAPRSSQSSSVLQHAPSQPTGQVQLTASGSAYAGPYQQSQRIYDHRIPAPFGQPVYHDGPHYTIGSNDSFSWIPNQYAASNIPRSLPHLDDADADIAFLEMMLDPTSTPILPPHIHRAPPPPLARAQTAPNLPLRPSPLSQVIGASGADDTCPAPLETLTSEKTSEDEPRGGDRAPAGTVVAYGSASGASQPVSHSDFDKAMIEAYIGAI